MELENFFFFQWFSQEEQLEIKKIVIPTLGCTRALDMGSLNYFEAFEMFKAIKTFYKFSVKLKN